MHLYVNYSRKGEKKEGRKEGKNYELHQVLDQYLWLFSHTCSLMISCITLLATAQWELEQICSYYLK